MDLVDELRAFVATAQTGSFTAAAHQLGVSNRLTSKYVAALEHRLGVRLLQRTTRKVGLTPAGEDLMARAPALLDDLDDLLGTVAEVSHGLTGVIRISAPVTFGEVYVTGMLERYARQNPALTLNLRLDDRHNDLASDGIDLAFRIGRSDMLSLRALKLGTSRSLLVASPDYIRANGKPGSPEDLAHHTCVVDTNRRVPDRWVFERDATETTVHVRGRFLVNSARAAMDLAIGGMGIANIPRFALGDALESGALIPLLEDFKSDSSPVSAVYLEGRALPRKVRALIDFAAKDIRSAALF